MSYKLKMLENSQVGRYVLFTLPGIYFLPLATDQAINVQTPQGH